MNEQRNAWIFLRVALFEPHSERRLNTLSALACGRTERWHRIVALANAHFVTPALWLALQKTPGVLSIPKDVREYLAAIYEVNRTRNRDLLRQLDRLIRALNARGIVPTLLKGAGYLKTGVHGDVGVRFLSDLDILVHPDQLETTRGVFESLSYVPVKAGGVNDETRHHHLDPMYKKGEPGVVEIHRDAVGAHASRILPTLAALSDARDHLAEDIHYRTLSPSNLVAVSFLHAEISDRHLTRFILGLRPMQDVAALHAKYDRLIDWSMLAQRLARSGLDDLFRTYLLAIGRITGIRPLPEMRFRMRHRFHYRVSEIGMQRPVIGQWLRRLTRLSAREVQRRYGESDDWVSLTRFRVRRARKMTRNWMRRLSERRGTRGIRSA